MPAPTLLTDRLTMRPHSGADLDHVCALWSNPDVARFIGGRPSTREECWGRLLRYVGNWAVMGFGFWAVFARDDGRYLGEAGFLEGRRALEPSLEGDIEMGWAFLPAAQGQGFASEALGAQLAWLDIAQPNRRVVCMINPENAPSIRLAGRHGFTPFMDTVYAGAPVRLFERALQSASVSG